ncbi:UNVERIFIED_CONTAM: hypothetical protein Sradi_4949400 [Sesamum radiatum]|uniref:Uncharacterized protein n=1 Tax=Sesamum radiatum TaxID=300843 RepID=A0AAW2MDU9_SESRA
MGIQRLRGWGGKYAAGDDNLSLAQLVGASTWWRAANRRYERIATGGPVLWWKVSNIWDRERPSCHLFLK